MSHNSNDEKGGGALGAASQAPKLRGAAHYGAWRGDTDVWLERGAAQRIHTRVMTAKQWADACDKVQLWKEEELNEALQLTGLGAASQPDAASSSNSSSGADGAPAPQSGPLTEAQTAARKLVVELVGRSTRVFGHIYSALPDDLRKQTESIARGHAYGLWHWLELKFQSTEQDSVGALLEQWVSLRQDEAESFDSYRARVDALRGLLVHAKEPPSVRMYSLMLLDRLQPHFNSVVLALKVGGALKDAERIDWETVVRAVNAAERDATKLGLADAGSSSGAWANAAQRGGRAPVQSRPTETRASDKERVAIASGLCFVCGKPGHRAFECPDRNRGASSSGDAPRSEKKLRLKGQRERSAPGTQRGQDENAFSVVRRRNKYGANSDESAAEASSDSEPGGRASCVIRVDAPEDEERAMAAPPAKPRLLTLRDAEAARAAAAANAKLAGPAPKKIAPKAGAQSESSAKKGGPAAAGAVAAAAPKDAGVPAIPSRDSLESRRIEARIDLREKQKPRTYAQIDAVLRENGWGADSMASVHVSGNREMFKTLRKCTAIAIKTANGDTVTASQCGSVELRFTADTGKNKSIVLQDVLFHKSFAANLLSVERLTKQLGWVYHSDEKETYLVTPGGSKVSLSTRGRIAVLLGLGPERVYMGLTPGSGVVRDDATDAWMLLHRRLCHMGWDDMLELVHSGRVDGLATLTEKDLHAARARVKECRACLLGKQRRNNFEHRGLERGSYPGEVLHTDTYHITCEQRDGTKRTQYGISVKDAHANEAWHSRTGSKDAVSAEMIGLIRAVERHTGRHVRRIYSDNGSEYVNQTLELYLKRNGIRFRPSPPYTQRLNGVAERSVGSFKDQGRTLLQDARAPEWLWPHAIDHAVWIWNRVRASAATGKTPYEASMGRKPSLRDRAHVWGSDCFVHQRKDQRSGAMAAKSEPGIYLGHSEDRNTANVWILRTGKRVATRDVRYHDGRFLHMRALVAGDDGVAAILDGSSELLESEEDSGAEPERMQAQGGRKQPSANALDESVASDGTVADDAAEADAEAQRDQDEWAVESIVARRVRPGHGTEYRVRWAGFSEAEDTWEPEDNVAECAALDTYLEAHPVHHAAPRQSPRPPSGQQPEAGGASDDAASAGDELWSDSYARVHMTVRAIRHLQTPDEQMDEQEAEIICAAIRESIASTEPRTPRNLREARASPEAAKWEASRQKEFNTMKEFGAWAEVPRSSVPLGKKILPYKEVFKIKTDADGNITQYKVRLTPKGNLAREGIDYHETFARTGMYKTERAALALAARFDNELVQFDVTAAYLHGDMQEEVYMEMPEGAGKPGMVCRLLKSIYGMPQGGHNWDKLIHGFLTGEMGWKACVSDPSFYYKRSRTGRLMLIYRFVDDMQGQYNMPDQAEFKEYSDMLRERFRITQSETAAWMLGMRITRDRAARTITLDQELYVTKALERFGLADCTPVSCPEVPGAASDKTPGLDKPTDRMRYMQITGVLMYAAISTRLDIAHAVHYLASHMVAPTSRHMQAAERVLRYLAGTRSLGLAFGSRSGSLSDSRGRAKLQVEVCAFADADWANNKGDRKSVSGWVAKLCGDPISWSSKKQRVVALSTCEAELYAEAAAIQEVLWLRGLLQELGFDTAVGSVVYGDNQAAIAVSKKGVRSNATKHVDVKYHFITETLESGQVKLVWVPTAQQQADIFTKPLGAQPFLKLRAELMTQ